MENEVLVPTYEEIVELEKEVNHRILKTTLVRVYCEITFVNRGYKRDECVTV